MSSNEMVVDMPATAIYGDDYHRCCEKCFKVLLKGSATDSVTGANELDLYDEDVMDVMEYTLGRPYRIYSVRIPIGMTSVGRTVKVSLDNRLWTVKIPLNICPGSTIRVRAPFSAAQLPSGNIGIHSLIVFI